MLENNDKDSPTSNDRDLTVTSPSPYIIWRGKRSSHHVHPTMWFGSLCMPASKYSEIQCWKWNCSKLWTLLRFSKNLIQPGLNNSMILDAHMEKVYTTPFKTWRFEDLQRMMETDNVTISKNLHGHLVMWAIQLNIYTYIYIYIYMYILYIYIYVHIICIYIIN